MRRLSFGCKGVEVHFKVEGGGLPLWTTGDKGVKVVSKCETSDSGKESYAYHVRGLAAVPEHTITVL
jgi:hypothetical protein